MNDENTKVTRTTMPTTKPARKRSVAKRPVAEPKPKLLFESRFGRSSFILTFVRHNREK